MAEKSRFNGTGRRKSSVARVTLTSPGKGNIEVNGVALDNYVPRESLATMVKQPLTALDKNKEYDISVNVKGGGLAGQAGAIRLGVTRALMAYDESTRSDLRSAGLVTRDARVVERKKVGRKKARKSAC